MGLAITVGALADLHEEDPEGAQWLADSLAQANALLQKAGLPQHGEPLVLPQLQSRASLDSFPYSYLHYLRRAYAHAVQHGQWQATPLAEGEDPSEDPVLEAAQDDLDSHLLCHSDCEGFYFPLVFDDVIFADDEHPLLGGMLGSSYSLRAELVTVAPALGIFLLGDELSDEEAARINARIDAEDGLERELIAWLAAYEACRLSIEHKTAIVFN
ncbi:hypothetical protein D9M09_13135 [Janthinobacterium agaricidamnosum]|uniref:Uncharacterized protein n=1 Tax=Janthinobacterium agaricidamnosum TaxID=55508 RepID=A0A3G2E9E7_9BURK|nr:hypothetical protein [Janthinobacterium agaricidamnosum]AYM76634.1 hypothetical protein D9M09_13135 [Janthinobacterium agaricidamnosum]